MFLMILKKINEIDAVISLDLVSKLLFQIKPIDLGTALLRDEIITQVSDNIYTIILWLIMKTNRIRDGNEYTVIWEQINRNLIRKIVAIAFAIVHITLF